MRNIQKNIAGFYLLLIFIGCANKNEKFEKNDDDGWTTETKVLKTIKNVNFVFPESGFAFDNKENLTNRCFDAIEHNFKILGKTEFNDTIYVRVMSSFDEMFAYTGTRASGNAYPNWSTLNIVCNEEETNPPIKHELMHLMAMLDWDYPRRNCTWMNEGLATFSSNSCNGNTVAEIYRYLLENEKLISMTDLSSDFYGQSEMVGYHQSGYIVEYLLKTYSIEQFRKLWIDGFEKFQEIYGSPYPKVKSELEKELLDKYPKVPEINWEIFNKGCQ